MKKIKTIDRVKMLRELNKLTRADFANIINLSPKTISRWENGDREITRENIKRISYPGGMAWERYPFFG